MVNLFTELRRKCSWGLRVQVLVLAHMVAGGFGPYQVGGGRNGCPVHVPYRTICNWWSHFEEFGEPPAITPLFMLLRFLLPWPFVVFFALFYFGMDDNCGDARVSYLAKRYGPHAPYWQFIIWARQIAILILARMVEKNWLLVLIGTLICLASISIHAKVKPFKYDFQNKMELWLMYAVTVIVISAGIYSEILKTWIKNKPEEIARWIFSLILLGGMFGSLLGATIYFRLFRKIYGSFHNMLKDRRRSSFIQIFKDENVEELIGEEISRIITSARDNDNCWQTLCKRVSFLPFVVLIAAIIISFAEGSLALGVFLTLIFVGSIIFYRYIAKKLAIRFKKARKGRFSTVDESILYSSSDEDNDGRSCRFSTFDEEESILYSSDDESSVYSSDDQEYCISEEDAFQEQDDDGINIM